MIIKINNHERNYKNKDKEKEKKLCIIYYKRRVN